MKDITKEQIDQGKITLGQLAKNLFNDTRSISKVEAFVEVNLSGLPVKKSPREHGESTFYILTSDLQKITPSPLKAKNALDIAGRIVKSGETLKAGS